MSGMQRGLSEPRQPWVRHISSQQPWCIALMKLLPQAKWFVFKTLLGWPFGWALNLISEALLSSKGLQECWGMIRTAAVMWSCILCTGEFWKVYCKKERKTSHWPHIWFQIRFQTVHFVPQEDTSAYTSFIVCRHCPAKNMVQVK